MGNRVSTIMCVLFVLGVTGAVQDPGPDVFP
jgi:hypothetical protein